MAGKKIVGGSFGIGGRLMVERDQFVVKARHGEIVSTYASGSLADIKVDVSEITRTSILSVVIAILVTIVLTLLFNILGFIAGVLLLAVGVTSRKKIKTTSYTFDDGKIVRVRG
jgi:hypothetical protein